MSLPSTARPTRWTLVGPIFFHELVVTARRGRYFLLRGALAGFLLLMVLWVFWNGSGAFDAGPVQDDSLAEFTQTFFLTFLGLQFVLAVLIAPAWTATAITDEKERRTLDDLLTTDLRSHEIVLGKLAARLGTILLLLLVGLPILSLVQFLGGVDPNLIVAGYGFLLVTVVSLAAMSLLVSVYARRSRTAVVAAYLLALFFQLGGLWFHHWLLYQLPKDVGDPLLPERILLPTTPPVTLTGLANGMTAGNLLLVYSRIEDNLATGISLVGGLYAALGRYAIFHILAALICTYWAAARLRKRLSASRRTEVPTHRREGKQGIFARLRAPLRVAPKPVGRWPLLWKELHTGLNWRKMLGLIGGIAVAVFTLFLASFPILIGPAKNTDSTTQLVLGYAALVSTCLLLGVLVRAAASVTGERERKTFDTLLTTPWAARDILRAKGMASLLTGRWVWPLLALLWGEMLILGSSLSFNFQLLLLGPVLFVIWCVYAALLTAIGLWFSVVCRTSLRALIGSLLTVCGLFVGPWLIALLFLPLVLMTPKPAPLVGHLALAQVGCTPPLALAGVVVPSNQLVEGCRDLAEKYLNAMPAVAMDPDDREKIFASAHEADAELHRMTAFGLLFWLFVAYVLWRRALARFRAQAFRQAVLRPEFPWPGTLTEGEIRAAVQRAQRRRIYPIGLTAGSLGLALVLVPVGIYIHRVQECERALKRAVAEMDRAEPRWRFEDIEADRATPPEKRNSAFLVLRAGSLQPPGWTIGSVLTVAAASPPERPDAQLVQQSRAELRAAEAALEQARGLAELTEGRYPIAWSPDIWSTPLRHMEVAGKIGTMLEADAVLLAYEGDLDSALRSVRAIVNTGRSIGDEPLLISVLERFAIEARAFAALERALAQGQTSDASLASVQDLLEREAQAGLTRNGIRAERAIGHHMLTFLESELAKKGASTRGLTDRAMPWFARLSMAMIQRGHAAFLRHATRAVEICRLPIEEWDRHLRILDEEASAIPGTARFLIPRFSVLAEAERRFQAPLRCALVAIAVERFRLAHHRWPSTLDELRPQFLDAIPLDPYDGKPLRYVRKDAFLLVYSIGHDRRDDGGAIDVNSNAPGKDPGFRLWDVSQRRK